MKLQVSLKAPCDKYTTKHFENLTARTICRSFTVAAFTSFLKFQWKSPGTVLVK